jgi:thymidylate synthase
MFFSADTLDDLMSKVLHVLIEQPCNVTSSRGNSGELIGVMLHLTNPLARISRTETKGKAFSALGELLWYLSKKKDLDFISYYIPQYKDESEDDRTVYGGYGPRIFNLRDEIDQMKNILDLLTQRQSSRKAVIQIFDGNDLVEDHPELPCTGTLQFLVRNNQLHMFTSMRSNDAFLGLPHDVFAFTMLQEIIARSLNVGLGIYTHAVGSLHLYDKHYQKAQQYLNEGLQSTKDVMPEMPIGNPWVSIEKMLVAELAIRLGNDFDEKELELDPYWGDLIRLLKVFSLSKDKKDNEIEKLKKEMHFAVYNTYINSKINKKKQSS